WLAYSGIAAGLLLCLTIGGYFLFNDNNDKPDDFLVKNALKLRNEHVPDIVASEYEQKEIANKLERKAPVASETPALPQSPQKVRESSPKTVAKEDVIISEDIEMIEEADIKMAEEADMAEVAIEALAMKKSIVVTDAERKAEPETGWEAYHKYLTDSIRRPTEGECAELKGTVKISFDIDENGVPRDFKIEESLCNAADAEAIRLIKEGSVWIRRDTAAERITLSVDFLK
ncbi:MAG: hypothetical protein LBT42_04885, partial [Tannerella sp.]|nr:hypothetical protein [Tannerella sp.]